jgi:glycosyltransferase involved in cell wall biosynthesis
VSAILVSHPHVAAVSAGVSQALARAGKLAGYVTGVAFQDQSWSGRLAARLAARRSVLRNRILPDIPPGRLRSLAPVELSARLVAKAFARFGVPIKPYDAIFAVHDAAVAAMPWPSETTAVYAYEDAALRTFRRARRRGLGAIWDLPLPHYLSIERTLREESQRWPGAALAPVKGEPPWKRRRKDAELALATVVSVASAFTKRSLESLDVGVPVVVASYGFPVERFARRRQRPSGPFTVLAVGTHDLRKGTPYLLEAWKRAAIPDAELHLVGPMRLAKSFLNGYAGTFRHWPHLPKNELPARYAAADLCAFPTLGDGFGLVMQESMCCGTAVVTTPCGGGPECITDGADGWIVPPRDIEALVERMRQAAADRERLFAMGQAARERAERWTWREAGVAFVQAIEAALAA